MGSEAAAAGNPVCQWCDRPLSERRWRRYCNRRHAMKHRIVDFIDSLLSGLW
ncbi:hypothetical protein [Streptomyces sp. AC627_RSS907]|uniref:hypothetical protein n=1 Tax=Streptomyces sp. AC627_RSS907 TaxID=2823684 RepID=UPI001C272C79|nr:hypothetical protein [Streptomyces sp. AC627_RSS907]